MMSDLESRFKKAYELSSAFKEELPADVMLRLYAYYKHAMIGKPNIISNKYGVRNAFKFNAWSQLKDMPIKEAKEKYIQLVEKITKNKIN